MDKNKGEMKKDRLLAVFVPNVLLRRICQEEFDEPIKVAHRLERIIGSSKIRKMRLNKFLLKCREEVFKEKIWQAQRELEPQE